MSQQNDLEIRIAAKTDESSIRRAKSAMESLADTSKDSVATINASVKSTSLLTQASLKAAKGQSEYNDELRESLALSKNINNLDKLKADAFGSTTSSGGGTSLGGAGAAKGAVRGVLGGSPLGQIVDTVGDLGEVASSIAPNVGGVTQALGALGVAGIAVGAALAIASGFLNEYNRQAEAQARVIGSAIDAQRNLNTEIANGLTSEQAQEKLSQINTEFQKQSDTLVTLEASYALMTEKLGLATGAAQIFSAQEEELSNQITIQKDLVAGLSAEQQGYSTALEDGSLAINDAIAAEQALANARTQGVLSAAAAAGEVEAARQSTSGKSKEAIQASIEAENQRIASLRAELDALKASGETSDAVTSRIALLESQLKTSADKVGVYTSALSGAQTESALSAQKTASKAKEASTQIDRLGSSLSGLSSQVKRSPGMSFGIPRQIRDAAKDTEALSKSQTEYANSLIEVNNNVGESLDDIRLNLSRSIEDLSINTGRSIQDALAEGSFLSIRNIQRDSRREMQDLERQSNRDRLDAQREGALEILRIEQQLAQDRARIAGGTGTTGGVGQLFSRVPR